MKPEVLVILIANEAELFCVSTIVEKQDSFYLTAKLAAEEFKGIPFDRYLIVQNDQVIYDDNFYENISYEK